MSPIASTATSLFSIIPTSIAGGISHFRHRTCVPKLGIALGIGGACLSPVGVWLASISPGWLVMVAASIAMAYSAITMFRKAAKAPKQAQSPAGANHASSAVPEDIPVFTPTVRQLALGAAIGLGAGLLSGFIGVGGGFIMVPLLLSIVGLPMKLASGTSLIAVLILAIPGAIEQGILGNIDYAVGLATACGTIPGALIGARLTSRTPERTLRFLFGGFLLAASVLMVVKELGLLG